MNFLIADTFRKPRPLAAQEQKAAKSGRAPPTFAE